MKVNTLRITLFCLLFPCFFSFKLWAQELLIKGIVVDEQSMLELPFVTIRLKGSSLGSIAEQDGRFFVKIPKTFQGDTLVFTCLGYEKVEKAIATFSSTSENIVKLSVNVRMLDDVVVLDDKQIKPEQLLKRIVGKVSENYPNQETIYDAYYRERITENGVTIKLVDAATTILQKGYTGKNSKSKAMFRQYLPLENASEGIMIGGVDRFIEDVYPGKRFHDHFGHIPSTKNRVIIHEVRKSANQSREGMLASVEGGPLSTLAKDLVMDIDLFLRKSKFNHYNYELFEVPSSEENWDYLIKFRPRKEPASLESIQNMSKTNKNISRSNILSGIIRVDQKTLAIKSISYRVEKDYRRHICSYQEQALKHYGYEVELEYQQTGDKWQIDRILRKDEFIFKDTVKQVTTPYSAIAELNVVNRLSKVSDVPIAKSFVEVWSNSLNEYPKVYNKAFWNQYEKSYNVARISKKLRRELGGEMSLEQQFILNSKTGENK